MPKRFFFVVAIAAAVLAACNATNPYLGTQTPATPTPNASYSPNPGITGASVFFSVAASPIPNQPIAMSTPDVNGRPGATLATVLTNSTGTSLFTGMTPAQTYCWTTMYTPVGAQPQSYGICAHPQYWQSTIVQMGNP